MRLLQSCITGVMQRPRTFFKMCPQPGQERSENRENNVGENTRQKSIEHGAYSNGVDAVAARYAALDRILGMEA